MDDAPTDRPAWAANLPDRATLDYVRALGVAAGLVFVAVWVACAVVRDPKSLLRIGRKQVGA